MFKELVIPVVIVADKAKSVNLLKSFLKTEVDIANHPFTRLQIENENENRLRSGAEFPINIVYQYYFITPDKAAKGQSCIDEVAKNYYFNHVKTFVFFGGFEDTQLEYLFKEIKFYKPEALLAVVGKATKLKAQRVMLNKEYCLLTHNVSDDYFSETLKIVGKNVSLNGEAHNQKLVNDFYPVIKHLDDLIVRRLIKNESHYPSTMLNYDKKGTKITDSTFEFDETQLEKLAHQAYVLPDNIAEILAYLRMHLDGWRLLSTNDQIFDMVMQAILDLIHFHTWDEVALPERHSWRYISNYLKDKVRAQDGPGQAVIAYHDKDGIPFYRYLFSVQKNRNFEDNEAPDTYRRYSRRVMNIYNSGYPMSVEDFETGVIIPEEHAAMFLPLKRKIAQKQLDLKLARLREADNQLPGADSYNTQPTADARAVLRDKISAQTHPEQKVNEHLPTISFHHSQADGVRPIQQVMSNTFLEKVKWHYASNTIFELDGVFYKPFDDKERLPGVEDLICKLYQDIIGYGCAPVEVIKVTFGPKREKTLYLQASLGVRGVTLKDYLEGLKIQDFPIFESYNFSAMIIMSILTNPSDAKYDNLMVSSIFNEAGQVETAKIIAIDNELGFSEDVNMTFSEDGNTPRHIPGAKNVLYMSPQMSKEIDANFKQRFLALSPSQLIRDWLDFIDKRNALWQSFVELGFGEKTELDKLKLPIKLLPGQVRTLFNKLVLMQRVMSEHESLSLNELFRAVQPTLYAYYAESIKSYYTDMFNGVPGNLNDQFFNTIFDSPHRDWLSYENIHNLNQDENLMRTVRRYSKTPEHYQHACGQNTSDTYFEFYTILPTLGDFNKDEIDALVAQIKDESKTTTLIIDENHPFSRLLPHKLTWQQALSAYPNVTSIILKTVPDLFCESIQSLCDVIASRPPIEAQQQREPFAIKLTGSLSLSADDLITLTKLNSDAYEWYFVFDDKREIKLLPLKEDEQANQNLASILLQQLIQLDRFDSLLFDYLLSLGLDFETSPADYHNYGSLFNYLIFKNAINIAKGLYHHYNVDIEVYYNAERRQHALDYARAIKKEQFVEWLATLPNWAKKDESELKEQAETKPTPATPESTPTQDNNSVEDEGAEPFGSDSEESDSASAARIQATQETINLDMQQLAEQLAQLSVKVDVAQADDTLFLETLLSRQFPAVKDAKLLPTIEQCQFPPDYFDQVVSQLNREQLCTRVQLAFVNTVLSWCMVQQNNFSQLTVQGFTEMLDRLTQVHVERFSPESQFFHGLKFQPIPKDGHCLFHAVGLYLGQNVNELRQMVANHMQENFDEFKHFREGTDEDFQQYIDSIRQTNEWGSEIEIRIIQRVMDRPIIIIRPDAEPNIPDDLANYQGEPIFIYYGADRVHYDAFVLGDETDSREVLNAILEARAQNQMVRFDPANEQSDNSAAQWPLKRGSTVSLELSKTLSAENVNITTEFVESRNSYAEFKAKLLTKLDELKRTQSQQKVTLKSLEKSISLLKHFDPTTCQLQSLNSLPITSVRDDALIYAAALRTFRYKTLAQDAMTVEVERCVAEFKARIIDFIQHLRNETVPDEGVMLDAIQHIAKTREITAQDVIENFRQSLDQISKENANRRLDTLLENLRADSG